MESFQQLSSEVNDFFQSTAKTFQSVPVLHNKLMQKTTWARAGQVQPMVQETEEEKDLQMPKYKGRGRPVERNEVESISPSSSESIEVVRPRLWPTQSRRRTLVEKKHPSSPIALSAMAKSQESGLPWAFLQKHRHDGIRKTVTWFGQPFHKILKKEAPSGSLDLDQNTYDANMNHLQPSRHIHQESRSIPQSTAKTLHCRILQITNFASGREYQYHLEVLLDGVVIHSFAGSTKRVTKGVSAASPQQTFTFSVGGPFELKFLLRGRPFLPTRLKDGIKRIKDLCSGPVEHPMPVIGSKQLLSGESVDQFAAAQGTSRYTLTPPLGQEQCPLDVEVMIMFRLDDPPKCPSGLHTFVASTFCHRSQDFQNCGQGGYLTFYVRGQGHPIWIRYWVKLKENGCLELYHATYKESLVDRIPIANIQTVVEPSEDDQERVYMASSRGLVLQFDRTLTTAAVGGLDGKMFFYADTAAQASCWRKELNAYAAVAGGDRATEKGRMRLRYIW